MEVSFFEMAFLARRVAMLSCMLIIIFILKANIFKFFVSISVSTRACHSKKSLPNDARKLGSTPRQRDLSHDCILRFFFFSWRESTPVQPYPTCVHSEHGPNVDTPKFLRNRDFLKHASSPMSSCMLILILETMILASLFVYQLVHAHVIIARSQRAKAGFDSQTEIGTTHEAFFMA